MIIYDIQFTIIRCIIAQPALKRAMRNLRVVRRPHDGTPVLKDQFYLILPINCPILMQFSQVLYLKLSLDPVSQAYRRWGYYNQVRPPVKVRTFTLRGCAIYKLYLPIKSIDSQKVLESPYSSNLDA